MRLLFKHFQAMNPPLFCVCVCGGVGGRGGATL